MESVLDALKGRPIPTLLVVAGVVFLLLSIAGQLAGRITVPPERQRQAMIIGGLLLAVGVALHMIPPERLSSKHPQAPPQTTLPPTPKLELPTTPTPPPSRQSSPSKPTTEEFKVVPVPSLNAHLTAFQFFEANPCDMPPLGQRIYRQRFAQRFTREILTELTLEHPKHERVLDFKIDAFYQREGKVVHSPVWEAYIAVGQEKSIYWFSKYRTGKSYPKRAPCHRDNWYGEKWLVGSYTVDVYINGEKAASGSFEIYE